MSLAVAVAQPEPTVDAHVDAIRRAKARLVVFPELSLTGYELDAPDVVFADLAPIVDACRATSSIALVGAPADGAIAILRVDERGVGVAYRKMFLGGDEIGRFTAGTEPACIDVDGTRVGLGICKDTRVREHLDATAELGVDLYAAGLTFRPEELDEHDARAARIRTHLSCAVAFASFAGPTGHGYDRTAGHSTIWAVDGTVLARAGMTPGEVVAAAG